ncbi:hypothetical protein Forpe1208_v016623 [Fusarium oxysporum f. sp. rapae]|uniref:Uncharacterized protein n=1 Tax=Fusarium oxysporum f. sp. rapae TaxID=485398 RepID=A0A8J5TP69_FUSOX|nr:hypothetical protein Forpe1208_v016623 [Fusarium oxysporum f. sp. rapae]
MGLRSKKPIVKQIIQEQMKRPVVRELSRRVFTSHHAAMRRFSSLDRDMPTAYCDEDKPPEESGAYCEIIAEATKEKADWTPEEATNPDSCNWPCEPDVEEKEGLVATEPQPEATECKPCIDGDINPSPNNTPTSDAPTEGEKELRPADPEQDTAAQKDCDKALEDVCEDMDSNTALLPFSSLYELLMGLQRYLERA